MSFTWLIVTVFGAGILLWNQIFLQMWLGLTITLEICKIYLLFIVVIQHVFIRNDANVIDLTLRLNLKVILGAISVAISIGVASFLVYFLKIGNHWSLSWSQLLTITIKHCLPYFNW